MSRSGVPPPQLYAKLDSIVSASADTTFERETVAGAILVTKYKTYPEDAQRLGRFRDYIFENYQSWTKFAISQGHNIEMHDLILVTGRDLTADFAVATFLRPSASSSVAFSLGAPNVGSVGVSSWGSWSLDIPLYTSWGPQSLVPGAESESQTYSSVPERIPPPYTQCVFLRGFRVYRRLLIPQVIKARAGYDNLGSGDRDNTDAMSPTSDASSAHRSVGSGDKASEYSVVGPPQSYDALSEVALYLFEKTSADLAVVHHLELAWILKQAASRGLASGDISLMLNRLVLPIRSDKGAAWVDIPESNFNAFHEQSITGPPKIKKPLRSPIMRQRPLPSPEWDVSRSTLSSPHTNASTRAVRREPFGSDLHAPNDLAMGYPRRMQARLQRGWDTLSFSPTFLSSDVSHAKTTIQSRLLPTIESARKALKKARTRAAMTRWLLNIAIATQLIFGAVTTGLSAAMLGKPTSIVTAILGAFIVLAASYFVRARSLGEPERSSSLAKVLEDFVRDCEAFVLDHGHEADENEMRARFEGYRRQLEELMGIGGGGDQAVEKSAPAQSTNRVWV
ncbi:hypothetical protein EIP91_000362 [Steccherinum ochraceum]|uniref:SMODS and SLOG-associating 2TM effector domain-containing protein n=1 Tax=Steccherinum ochraceum TaxID=92696 RepID=A0A4R0RK11_9APHY|nr:hypothetical protein EIP91_000362 [Steccherinum ochraceum]